MQTTEKINNIRNRYSQLICCKKNSAMQAYMRSERSEDRRSGVIHGHEVTRARIIYKVINDQSEETPQCGL